MATPLMSFGSPWSPQVPQLPEDVRNPLGSLGSVIGEIAKAQRARQMDELKLKEAQMSLAEKKREQENAIAFQQAMRRALVPLTPATTNPRIGPPVLEGNSPEEQRQLAEQAIMRHASPDKAMELLRIFNTNDANIQRADTAKMNARTNFLKAVSGKASGIKRAFGGNLEAMESLGIPLAAAQAISQLPDEAVIEPYEVNIGGVPFIRYTVKGEPRLIHKWTGEIRTDMLAMDPSIAPAVAADQQREMDLARARAQAQAQAQIQVGQTLGRDVETFTDAQGGVWERKKQVGSPVTPVMTQPGAPAPAGAVPSTMPPNVSTPNPNNMGSDAPPPPPPPLPQGAQESLAMDMGGGTGTGSVSPDMAPAPTASSTTPLYGEQLRGKTTAANNANDLRAMNAINRVQDNWQRGLAYQGLQQIKNSDEIMTQLRAIVGQGDTRNAIATIGALYDTIKAFDYNAVREGELALVKTGQSLENMLETSLTQLRSGGVVSDKTINDMASTIKALKRGWTKRYNAQATRMRGTEAARLKKLGLIQNEDEVIALEPDESDTVAPTSLWPSNQPTGQRGRLSGGVGLTGTSAPTVDDPASPDFWK